MLLRPRTTIHFLFQKIAKGNILFTYKYNTWSLLIWVYHMQANMTAGGGGDRAIHIHACVLTYWHTFSLRHNLNEKGLGIHMRLGKEGLGMRLRIVSFPALHSRLRITYSI